ncbi:N-acetylmuramoyl-L-alanine amidase [Thiosulfatimonas sediminis]|uniref:N-acetylmuramoyl-L-alanine amidase n=1 Tax=Thiosulfatimonas sediminis TaxID=2675054 RepID=A0A6F8PU63_9GAMM|nr:N-acetylmuramoyl-L-alanine amidase [Thiosulfatimonas sediminis]BBP45671.1 N-acetylmuramoyl-L-alanine amidase [Thiosulfatimonas sediminis]
MLPIKAKQTVKSNQHRLFLQGASLPASFYRDVIKLFFLVGLSWGLLLNSALAFATGSIQQVRVGQDAQKTRIVFDLKAKTKFQVRMLNNPSRVVVVFNNVANNISFTDKVFSDARLYKMLVAEQGKQTQVTLQLHKTLDVSSFHLAENAKGFNRLVIDLKEVETQPIEKTFVIANAPKKSTHVEQPNPIVQKNVQTAAAEPSSESVQAKQGVSNESSVSLVNKTEPSPEMIAKPDDSPQGSIEQSIDILLSATQQAAQPENALETSAEKPVAPLVQSEPVVSEKTSEDVSLISANQDIKASVEQIVRQQVDTNQKLVVALDAGHGGKDPGAINRQTRLMEKEATLQMAKELKRLIDAQPNMRAVLIRDRDVFIPLGERQKIAKQKGADVFISIHADAFDDPTVQGGSVYVLSRQGASSHMAKLLAKSENAYLQDVSLKGLDDDVAYALSDLSRRFNIEHSQKLANSVLEEMGKRVTMHRPQVQSAQFAVLKAIDIPSMLIETAFISNPNEARNLMNPLFQKQMANAIVAGLSRYVKNYRQVPIQGTNTLFVRYEVRKGDNLTMIAKKFNVSIAKIKYHNQIQNSNRLQLGKRLRIPVTPDLLARIDQIS